MPLTHSAGARAPACLRRESMMVIAERDKEKEDMEAKVRGTTTTTATPATTPITQRMRTVTRQLRFLRNCYKDACSKMACDLYPG